MSINFLGRLVDEWVKTEREATQSMNNTPRIFVDAFTHTDLLSILCYLKPKLSPVEQLEQSNNEYNVALSSQFYLNPKYGAQYQEFGPYNQVCSLEGGSVIGFRHTVVSRTTLVCLYPGELKAAGETLGALKILTPSILHLDDNLSCWVNVCIQYIAESLGIEAETTKENDGWLFEALFEILLFTPRSKTEPSQFSFTRRECIIQFVEKLLKDLVLQMKSSQHLKPEQFLTLALNNLPTLDLAKMALKKETFERLCKLWRNPSSRSSDKRKEYVKIVKLLMKHERQLSAYLSKREFSNRAGDTAYFKRKDLEENLKIIEASLTDDQVDLLREFAGREPDVTSFNQGVMNNKEVLDIDWELTQQFFDSPKNMKKTKKEHLGRETENYLKQIFILESDVELSSTLKSLTGNKKIASLGDLQDIYQEWLGYKDNLTDELNVRWVKLFNKSAKVYTEFETGLLNSVASLLEVTDKKTCKDLLEGCENVESLNFILRVRNQNKSSVDFWKGKNKEMAHFIYYQMDSLNHSESLVQFDFAGLRERIHANQTTRSAFIEERKSQSKIANRLTFDLSLERIDIDTEKSSKVVISFDYQHNPKDIQNGFAQDLQSLCSWKNVVSFQGQQYTSVPLLHDVVVGNLVSTKGGRQGVNLEDFETIFNVRLTSADGVYPSDNTQSGKFIFDQSELIPLGLDTVYKAKFLDLKLQSEITKQEFATDDMLLFYKEQFLSFHKAYSDFLILWCDTNSTSENLLDALSHLSETYQSMLETLRQPVFSTVPCKIKWWEPLLNIGFMKVEEFAGSKSSIVLPFSPIKLHELHIKLQQRDMLVRTSLERIFERASIKTLQGTAFHMRDHTRLLRDSYYPSVIYLGQYSNVVDDIECAQFAQSIQNSGLYTYFKPTVFTELVGLTIRDFSTVIGALEQTILEYLELSSHQSDYLTVGVLNPPSQTLIEGLIGKLSGKVCKKYPNIHIQILIIGDEERNRDLYTRLYSTSNPVLTLFDEGGENRFQVRFVAQQDKFDADVTLIHNFFSSVAKLQWQKRDVPNQGLSDVDIYPSSYSKVVPFDANTGGVSTYKTAKYQSKSGRMYTNLIGDLTDQQSYTTQNPSDRHFEQFINIQQSTSHADTLRNVQKCSDWIVSCDDIADQRVFRQYGFDIIRHFTQEGASIVVATQKAPLLMNRLLSKRINTLLNVSEYKVSDEFVNQIHGSNGVIDRLVSESNRVSGQMVMRASKRGKAATELLGTVIAMHQIRTLLDLYPEFKEQELQDQFVSWSSLDEYKSHFGLEKGQIADVMAIAPGLDFSDEGHVLQKVNGLPVVNIVLAESKCSGKKSESAMNTSIQQVAESVRKFFDSLRQGSLSRQVYLRRLADLYQSNVPRGEVSNAVYESLIRDQVTLRVFGVSYVSMYAIDEANTNDTSERKSKRFKGAGLLVQEILYPSDVLRILERTWKGFFDSQTLRLQTDNLDEQVFSVALPEEKLMEELLQISIQQFKPYEDDESEEDSVDSNVIESVPDTSSEQIGNPKDSDTTEPVDIVQEIKEGNLDDDTGEDSRLKKNEATSAKSFSSTGSSIVQPTSLPKSLTSIWNSIGVSEMDLDTTSSHLVARQNEVSSSEQDTEVEDRGNLAVEPEAQVLQVNDLGDNVGEESNQVKNVQNLEVQPEVVPVDKEYDVPHLQRYLEDLSEQTQFSRQMDDDWLKKTTETLHSALNTEFNGRFRLLECVYTPVSARITFQGDPKLQAAIIYKKREYFKSTYALNILDAETGLGTIIIHVRRVNRQYVDLPTLLLTAIEERGFTSRNTKLLVAQSEVDSENIYVDVKEHSPHTLIAGSSGSGKGILLQNLLFDICLSNHPDNAEIYLIDPKGEDFFYASKLPHFRTLDPNNQYKFISTQTTAIDLIEHLVHVMEERNSKQREHRFKYGNQKPLTFSHIWLVHDELENWTVDKQYANAINTNLSKLAQKGRSVQISLIIATQRPSNEVIDMKVRANLGNRLVLKVADSNNSKIALGDQGASSDAKAERLEGKGHILCALANEPDLKRGQVPFLDPMSPHIVSLAEEIAVYWRDA